MNQPLMEFLNSDNAEQDLFEDLLKAVVEKKDPTMIAAKIQATRDIRFTLAKILKENDYLRTNDKKTSSKETEA